jgi:hypothetical protein
MPLDIIVNQLNQVHIHTTYLFKRFMNGIARGYGLDGQGCVPARGKKFFSTPQRLDGPDRL